MESDARPRRETPATGIVKSPQALASGIFLLALAAIGFFGTMSLATGTLAEFGPAMLPRMISLLLGLCGFVLVAAGLTVPGERLEGWSARGLICILGAIVVFGLTLRGFDVGFGRTPAFGLVVAGPLAVTLASLADPETRPMEIAAFAIGLTALCIGLFRFVLRLPIPIAPWLLGY